MERTALYRTMSRMEDTPHPKKIWISSRGAQACFANFFLHQLLYTQIALINLKEEVVCYRLVERDTLATEAQLCTQ